MNSHVEDYSTWDTEALIRVPPETLEYSDLVGLVIEMQLRLSGYVLKEQARSYQGGW